MGKTSVLYEDNRPLKKQRKIRAEPHSERDALADELTIIQTGLYSDITMLISCYAQPCIGEEVGPVITMTRDDLSFRDEHFQSVHECLHEHLKHGVMNTYVFNDGDAKPTRQTILVDTRPIIAFIIKYMTLSVDAWSKLPISRFNTIHLSDTTYRVYRNIIYFFDRFENNVIGYIAMGDSVPFVFTRDATLDCFVDLNRRIASLVIDFFHDRTDFSREINLPGNKIVQTVSVSTPIDVGSDISTIYEYPIGGIGGRCVSNHENLIYHQRTTGHVSILHRSSNKIKKFQVDPLDNHIFGIESDHFVEMRLTEHSVDFYRLTIYDNNPKPSYLLLQPASNQSDLRSFIRRGGRCLWDINWRNLNGAILGHNRFDKEIVIIRFTNKKGWNFHIFKWEASLPSNYLRVHYAMCGRWLVEITYFYNHISVRRFSLDLRVLT